MKNQNKFLKKLAGPYYLWMIFFIVVPLILVFWYSITPLRTGDADTFSIRFTLSHFQKFFNKSYYIIVLYNSFKLAFYSTIFTLIIGYPIALYIANLKGTIRNFLLLLIIIPMWSNMLLRTYAWTYLLESNGIINNIINKMNHFLPFNLPYLEIMNTQTAVILGMVYNFLPFMILPIYSVLVKIDKDLLNAAYDLGANKWQGFMKVTLPLSVSGIVSGILMVFLPAATSFIIPAYLGGNKVSLIGNVIESYFKGMAYNPNFGSALAIILMIIIFLVTKLFGGKEGTGRGESLW